MRMTTMMRLIRRRIVVIGAGCSQNRAGHTKNRKKDIDKSQPERMATFEFFERSRQLHRGCGIRAAQPLKTPAVKYYLGFSRFPCVVHRRKLFSVQ
jgi:hypothetical protein